MRGRLLYLFVFAAAVLDGQQEKADPASPPARITTPAEVQEEIESASPPLLNALSWPHRKVSAGMERGLVKFEKYKVRERAQDAMARLRARGITPKFGGSGEGSGFGGGAIYDLGFGESHNLRFLGLLTFKNYQEGGIQWSSRFRSNVVFVESSYQWRPQENYYGQGHNTWRTWRTNYALRQGWSGLRWEGYAHRRIRLGALQRGAWMTASEGRNEALPVITDLFTELPGYRSETRLSSTGFYVDVDGLRDEYRMGGAIHTGATYNQSVAGGNLSYFSIEAQAEGRTPVKPGNSVLVGLANLQLNRARGGSDRIPFYLQPHIGGSSTLRGYQLDRFYGPGLIMASLEYRVRIHPNIQFYPFFDEGQIFSRTSDLSWLDWHRNYGFGFRLQSARGNIMTFEFGWGGEGTQFHLLFGSREQPPLRGPMRSGVYRR